jgi:hypothetical protein
LLKNSNTKLLKNDKKKIATILIDNEQQLLNVIDVFQKIFIKIKNSHDQKFLFESVIFEVLKLFATTQNIDVKTSEHKNILSSPNENVTDILSQCFTFKKFKPLDEPMQHKNVSNNNFDFAEMIKKTLANHDNEITQKNQEIIKKIKTSDNLILDVFKPIKFVFSSSKNSIIVLFENNVDLEIFNNALYFSSEREKI